MEKGGMTGGREREGVKRVGGGGGGMRRGAKRGEVE